jgi:hypothetical protein
VSLKIAQVLTIVTSPPYTHLDESFKDVLLTTSRKNFLEIHLDINSF